MELIYAGFVVVCIIFFIYRTLYWVVENRKLDREWDEAAEKVLEDRAELYERLADK